MADELVHSLAKDDGERHYSGFSIAPGVITNNIDILSEARVQVRVPALRDSDFWARMAAVGGGSGRGFLWIPEVGDEVLVAFSQNDDRDAYVIGGLWNTLDRPPVTLPTDFITKRVIKTGKEAGLGHEIEFDDLLQSITITTSTKQKISIDPLAIEISTIAGSLSIKMDNKSQTISITALKQIELKAPQISLQGVQIELKGVNVSVNATGPCAIQGLPIKLN
jgi:uncharacterized protein involved in type VI secretion and phage assembly